LFTFADIFFDTKLFDMKIFLLQSFLGVCLLGFPQFAEAQTTKISGYIADKTTHEPIAGASVSLAGTTVAAKTDAEGKFYFSINKRPPLTVLISFIGYTPVEHVVNGSTDDFRIELEPAAMLGQEVVISASRVPERILESPVSIERIGSAAIKETPGLSFYDALSNLKGVEFSTQSLTFSSVNTRGFNDNGNFRFNQFVDGMDNQAPGLNFDVGNIIGLSDLDVDNAELLPGAASALYGAGGINGTLLMTSKNPFQYPGVSFQFKSGINHLNDDNSSVQPFNQLDVRMAKSWNNKFGIKTTFSFLQAKDWFADNTSDYDPIASHVKPGDRSSDPNYNGVNVYGDEVSQNMRNVAQAVLGAGQSAFVKQYGAATGGMVPSQQQINGFLSSNPQTAPFYTGINTPGLLPNENVSRTGYNERDLIDNDVKSLKTSTAVYYKITNSITAIAQANWGNGTSAYTGSDRYSIRNFTVGQYKLELKGDDFFLRGYTTRERSGDSYISSILGSYINELSKPSQQWFPEYVGNYIGARLNPGVTDAQANTLARAAADQGRFQPGTPAFENAKNTVAGNTISSGTGARFDDKTNMYHYEVMYNFSRLLKNVLELQAGSSYRKYQLRSGGTIFDDLDRTIDINEFGAFMQLGKRLFDDKLKLSVAGRYDKSQNFDGRFTPRITAVYTVAPDHYIRASYQTGFRNPTTQNQYLNLAAGGGTIRLIGGLPEMLDKFQLNTNRPFTADSYQAYVNSAALGVPDPALLHTYNFNPKGVQPETVQAFELGYKALLFNNLLLDAYAYYNSYQNFISEILVYQNNDDNFTSFSVPVNAAGKVKTYGAAAGLDYLIGKYSLSGNVSYNQIDDLPAAYVNNFNTPTYRFNLGLGNKNIIKNVGFNVNYRWQGSYFWNSPFISGAVPSFATFDGQVNLKIPSVNSMIKIGGTNLLNKYYLTSFGNPQIGALYYISYGFNL
jgi:outer membrane receptor protein involved in Fe transport